MRFHDMKRLRLAIHSPRTLPAIPSPFVVHHASKHRTHTYTYTCTRTRAAVSYYITSRPRCVTELFRTTVVV
jgi:hypothetical protein